MAKKTIPKGCQLQFQMETFRKVIRDNLPHRGMKTCFIHGIGGSIQKTASESNWMSPCPQMQLFSR